MNKEKLIEVLRGNIELINREVSNHWEDMSSKTLGEYKGKVSAMEATIKSIENGDFDD